ncbi:hypothetical protein GF407_09040 [candidate division KSB1 bacterium]|nr:hypothetical protein [candidate division KSB1 bacterium]
MKKWILVILLCISSSWSQHSQRELLKDESAPGARASLGLAANAYSRAITRDLFHISPYSLKGTLSRMGVAALSYQLISYDTFEGITLKPWQFDKEWKGYWVGFFAEDAIDLTFQWVRRNKEAQFFFIETTLLSLGLLAYQGEIHHKWRLAEDETLSWKNLLTNRNSYLVHFAGSGGLYWAFYKNTRVDEQALLYTLLCVWVWEFKDGYLHWEDVGFIGGDGFSWNDGGSGTIATLASYFTSKWIFPWLDRTVFEKLNLSSPVSGFKTEWSLLPTGTGVELNLTLQPANPEH